jgi:hypothetical protein
MILLFPLIGHLTEITCRSKKGALFRRADEAYDILPKNQRPTSSLVDLEMASGRKL